MVWRSELDLSMDEFIAYERDDPGIEGQPSASRPGAGLLQGDVSVRHVAFGVAPGAAAGRRPRRVLYARMVMRPARGVRLPSASSYRSGGGFPEGPNTPHATEAGARMNRASAWSTNPFVWTTIGRKDTIRIPAS